MTYGHGRTLTEWRAEWRARADASGVLSLYTPRGRLNRAITFARRDGQHYVTVHVDDLRAALACASITAHNPPTGRTPADEKWRRRLLRYLGTPTT